MTRFMGMVHLLCVAWLLAILPADPAAGHPGSVQRALPPLDKLPFLTVWNAPTASCSSRYGVDLDLSVFDIVANHDQIFMGDNITIFYESHLGLYPHFTSQGEAVYGGVPQNSSLKEHLWQADNDLRTYMPDRYFHGLAIIDWEHWRPTWDRNWDSKRIYWDASRALVKVRHPDWSPEQVDREARAQFEAAAQAFMGDTLMLAARERPGGLWGFYGFPSCYNYQYHDLTVNYTGECPELEVKRNDGLLWLWKGSSALYPDIYLELGLRGRPKETLLYARHRVLEAMRVREQVTVARPPVLPYARIAYTYSLDFLSEVDLIHTIGESAALGAAGVVLWGDGNYAASKMSCNTVKAYVDEVLGRYVVNVTTAAYVCSREICHSNGRCQRRDPASGAYLHLDPSTWSIIPRSEHASALRQGPAFRAQRKPGLSQDKATKEQLLPFKCQCFPGWIGEHCSVKQNA
ncbi:hypothetical protein AALO_G00134170 [Alosa alosa]|uniref:Hyaluronidase n=1 Tax=Alosa alosa TaxID=278164 RepID=A0AAV6GGI6_9TELE|nr:hyaluronidase-1 [Alosa alosa]KAG5274264.1 hypothetical protein AALO_G00134170 [Alosa alosa]